MSALTVLDLDGSEKDSRKVAYFLDDFFQFCSDRLVILYNGDSCKFFILLDPGYFSLYYILVGIFVVTIILNY